MFVVAGAAGPASFTHVHNVASNHGQPGWIAWADAVVLELMSVAAGLELRRRKRSGASVRFPAAVLGCAVLLSLAAQVVEAEASPIGWIAAAIPALGFLVMVKIALGHTNAEPVTGPPPTTPTEPTPAASVSGPQTASAAPPPTRPDPPDSGDRVTPDGLDPPVRSTAARDRSVHRSRSGDGDAVRVLLPAARAARDRIATDGQPLTRGALARHLRAAGHGVSNNRASALLKVLKAEDSAARPGSA